MRTQIKPSVSEENFASTQNITNSVNACYSLYCKVARDGKGTYYKDTTFKGKKFNWATIEVTPDKLLHGKPCACGLSYDQKTKKFYETGKQVSATNIKISEIYDSDVPGYQATWKSTDAILINTMVMLLMISQINQTILNTEHPFCVFLYLKKMVSHL